MNSEPVLIERSASVGCEEIYIEWFICPKCQDDKLCIHFNFCPNCGVAIKFAPKKKKAKFPRHDIKLDWS